MGDKSFELDSPELNTDLSDVKSISLCEQHACAVDVTGKLFTWGTGFNG